ncbi:hypothetical protein [Leptospira santarosai]|uniref:hypothetical protein n=1 Tax=Leptospira santarosai TaxID=28183 RepID=UPI001F1FDDAC
MSKRKRTILKTNEWINEKKITYEIMNINNFRDNSRCKVQERLSLESKPTHRVEFEALNNPKLKLNGTKVESFNGQPGKGSEFMTTDPVKVKLINVQPLR